MINVDYEREKNAECARLIRAVAAAPIRINPSFDDKFRSRPRPIYTGDQFKFCDYYVREVRSVYLEIVGTGRTVRVGRRVFEREARPA